MTGRCRRSEVQQDMATAVSGSPPPPDTAAPLGAVRACRRRPRSGRSRLRWAASSDNVGVSRYNVHRSQTAGFTPAAGNRIAQPTGTSYTDSGLAAGTYYYRVTAEDAAGNVSGASAQVTAVVPADQPPTVSITAPAAGATVSGTVAVTAGASDDVGVAGVQFRLGAGNLGSEDTSAPYSISWDTTTVSNGSYSITAVARDTAGQTTTSTADHRHRQQRRADRRSRRGLRIQRGLGLDRRRLVRRRQHGVRLRRDAGTPPAGTARRSASTASTTG